MSVTPVGGETLVNTTTANTQQTQPETPQAVASDANGNFVVVWTDSVADGSGAGVYAQRFDASGAAIGGQFRVNSTTAGNQDHASVAMNDDGEFVVTWSSAGQDGSGQGVYAQRYNAAGVAQGAEFRVNSTTSGDQDESAVAMDASGNFVIAWTSDGQDGDGDGVYAQRYNSSGVAQGGEFQVNSTTSENQSLQGLAMNDSGAFVVAFSSGSSNVGIRAQRYNAAGVAQGGQIQVNSTIDENQNFGAIALDNAGNFIITWSSFDQDAAGTWGIYMQRFDSTGTYVGAETLVNTTTTGDQQWSRVALNGAGEFVITWASHDQDAAGTWGIYGQEFNSSGVAVGTEFQVNTVTAGDQIYAAISPQGSNNFVIVWSGQGSGDGSGVFFQRLDDGVNQGPTNTVPGVQSTNEDTAIVFSSGNGNRISIVDPDVGSNLMRITLTAANGTMTLNGTTGLAFTTGDGTADATLVFTGTLANVNAALNGLSFTPTNNFTGAASITILTSDQGHSGSGGALTDSDTVNITVNAVNDAPVFNVPGAQSVNEDTNLVFSSGNGNLISITDIDSGGSSIQVTLSATNGTLTLNGTTGLSFTSGDGTADATMTFTGSRANINSALAGMFFRATNNYNGGAAISLDVNDQGNTGSGGALTDSASVNVTVNAVNDNPVNSVPGAQSINEDSSLVFSAGNGNQISISDVDAGGAAVEVTLTAGNGTITLAGITGLTFSSGSGTADATMTFNGTIANINAALNGLSFAPTGNFNGLASLQIVTNDQGNTGAGGARTDTDTVNITVNAVNDGPANTVPAAQSTNEDVPLVFSSGNGNQISIADPDSGGSSVRVTLTATNGEVTLNGTAGLAFSVGDGTSDVTMTFTGTIASVNAALNGLAFTPTLNFNGAASLQIATNDQGNTGAGGALSDTDTVNITVNALNDAPVNNIPAAQSTNEDTALVFSSGNGNQISITDVDAGGSPVRVTLTATNGALTLNGVTGLAFSTGDGTADATMTFTGTVADINSALNGLSFIPTPGFGGAASLQIVTNDQGHTGPGGALSDTDTVNITVVATNDAPVNSVPGPQTINEDAVLVFSTGNGNLISVSDVDAGGASVRVTLTAANGAITLNGVVGLAFTVGDGTADATMTFTGAITDINTALDGLSFTPTLNFNGAASLQIVTNDQGNTGAGGALSDTDTVNITVNAVNDSPVNNVPPAQSTNEDATLVFSSGNGNQISITDVDAGGSPVEVTLTSTNGALTLNGIAGLTFSSGDGTGDASMTFTGTVAAINTALNGLSFTPTLNYNGPASLQIATNDQGSAGVGGALSDSDTVNITVNAVNDAPVNTVPGAQAINEDATLTFSTAGGNAISIADLEAGGAPVQVTLAATNGTLSLNGVMGLIFSVGDGTGDATMTFTGAIADINAALDGLTYSPTANYTGAATLTTTTNDLGSTGAGGPQSDVDVVNIAVAAVNDAPANTVPGPQATNEDTPLVFSAGNGNQISIADLDAGGSPVEVTLTATGGAVTLNGVGGLTFSTGDGTTDATMTFTGTVANINAALNGLSFTPTLNLNGAASLQIVTNDQGNTGAGGAITDSDTVNITVNAINDAPVNTAPGPQSITEDYPLVFSTVGGNAISISDVDSSPSPVEVTLTATNGTLTLAGTAGLTFSAGGGTGDATMTFTGTVSDLNAALDGLAYVPTLDYDGPANISITTSDLGNTGVGGPLTAASNVAITVIPENDAPTIVVPSAQEADTFGLVFSAATGNPITIIDTDVTATDLVQISLVATNGLMTLRSTSGLTFLAGDGSGDASMTFTGTLVAVNAALDGLSFTPSDMNASIQVTADDLGSNGLGGPQSATTAVAITQVPLIPPPSPTQTTPAPSPAVTIPPSTTTINRESLVASRAAPPPRTPDINFTAVAETPISSQFNIRLASNRAADMAGMIDDALGTTGTRLLGSRGGAAATGIRAAQLTLLDNDLLWDQLDSLARKMETDQFASPMLVGATAGMGMALTSGYLLWCLRGGSLLASALSTMPMWRTFDPLPVLEFWEKQGDKKQTDDDDDGAELGEAEDASLDNVLT